MTDSVGAIYLPAIVLYALLGIGLLRRFTLMPSDRQGDADYESMPMARLLLTPRGSELTLASIVLDAAQLAITFQNKLSFSVVQQDRATLVVAALLLLIHLQAHLFVERLEQRMSDGHTTGRTVLKIRALLIGMAMLFTNAITVAALLR